MPFFQQELMERAQEKGSLTDQNYKKALAKCRRLTQKAGIDALVRKHKLDVIVAPTAGPSWVIDYVNGDHADSGCASPPAVAGYPHITVPAGFVAGLPWVFPFLARPGASPS
jgi:amidase